MPLYEYQCQKCAKRTEKIESVAGPHLKKCPHCGGKVERLQSAPAIQFKGSGWYVTDYAGKSSAKESGSASGTGTDKSDKKESTASDSGANESSAKESKDKKESEDNKENKDSKPAKKN